MNQQHPRYRAGRRWLIVLSLVATVLVHGLIIARLFLSPEQFRFRTEQFLQQYFPGDVSLGAAGYELPGGFRLGEIALSRPDELGGGPLFRSKLLRVDCRLLPLFGGEVVLDDVVFEQPELLLTTRDRSTAARPERELPQVPANRIIWRSGRIQLGEGVLFEGSPTQELRQVNVELTKARRLENAFEFEGSAASGLWGRCDLEGTVDLKRRRLDALIRARRIPIDEQVRGLLPPMVLRSLDRYGIKGAVDLTVETSVAWASDAPPTVRAVVELRDCEATYDRFPLRCTDIRGRIVLDGTNIYYRDIQARAGPASLELSGRTSREKVEMRLVVRDRPLDGDLYKAVAQATTPDGRLALKAAWDRCGIHSGLLSLDYQSTWLRQERKFQAKVRAQVRDAAATYTKFPYPLTDIVGTVRWEDRVTYIDRLTGRRGKAAVEITGQVTDKGVPDLRIQASDVPFDETLRKALTPGWRKTFDELRPEGRAATDIRVTCPTGDPRKLDYRLVVRPQGASFQHRDSPHRVRDVRGEIVVDETGSVSFRDLRGRVGDVPIQILGTVTASPGGPVLDITVLASEVALGPAARALLGKRQAAVYDYLAPRGTVRVAWKLATDAKSGATRHSTQIHCLHDCSIRVSHFPVAITGLMGDVFVGHTGRTVFTGMKGRIGRAAVEAIEGRHEPDAGGLRFTLRGRGLVLNEALRRALPTSWHKVWDELGPSGEVDVEYQYAANPKEPTHPSQRISIEPANAAFCYRRLALPISDVARGKVTFDQHGNATISNVQGKLRGKTVQLSGKVTAGAQGGTLRLDVSAAELPLDAQLREALGKEWQEVFDQLKLGGTIGAEATMQANLGTGALERFRLQAELKECEATWATLPVRLTGLRGRIEYDDGVTTLSRVTGRAAMADELRLDGRIAREGAGTRLRLTGRNVRLDPHLSKALPADVRKALDVLAFRGAADLDLTITRPADAAKATECVGVVSLRECGFRRNYDFEQVSGDVRIDRGLVAADGSHDFSGSLRLHKLVVRKLAVTGLGGQFAYRGGGKGQGAARVKLSALEGGFYGGRLSGEIDTGLGGKHPLGAVLRASGVDFSDFLEHAVRSKYRASGSLDLRLEFPPSRSGDGKKLVGDGWALVRRGELGALPITAALFSVLRLETPERSLTKADIRFGIAQDHLEVSELLLGRDDLLLTRGYGTIGFDGKLDLKFITPKRGLIQTLVGLGVDSLVGYQIGGTLAEPKPSQRTFPITRTIFDEFKRGFGIWKALSPGRPKGSEKKP